MKQGGAKVRVVMRRLCFALVGAALLGASGLLAQDGVERGEIKKVDRDKNTIVITSGGKDHPITVPDNARLVDEAGQPIKDRLADKRLRSGAVVQFKTIHKDGQEVLLGMKLGTGPLRNPPPKVDLTGLKPLTELTDGEYKGYPGGLYPKGRNERPDSHEKAGLALTKKVRPLDENGKPADNGKIVLLSVGMSNTTQEFSQFKQLADRDGDKNPRLVLVDGAQGGMTAAAIKNEENPLGKRFWKTVDERLKRAGASRAQVQVAWLKEADAGPNQGFPKYAETLQEELGDIVRLMHARFPNLKMVYLSSRIFAGYAKTRLNPEPYAYESGFSVKWLIEQQIQGEPSLNFDPAKGEVKAPWLSWGPYLWANGKTKNADGLCWEEDDLSDDGTHPSPAGRRKVAERLLRFCKTDSTAKPWFLKP
jgi:hypothetical protein